MAKFEYPKEGYAFDYYGDHASFVDDSLQHDYAFRIEFGRDMPEEQRQAICAMVNSGPIMLSALRGVIDCLSQNKTFPADIAGAKQLAARAIETAEMFSDEASNDEYHVDDSEALDRYAAAATASLKKPPGV